MEDKKLHAVMIPWLAFGHMIPYLELAKSIAMRGHLVTFISTPRNIERLPTIPPSLSHLLNLVPLTPHFHNIHGQHELPQATCDVPLTQQNLIKKLLDDLEDPIESFLRGGQVPPPDWIIYDLFVYWAPRLAHSLGVPCAFFCVLGAKTLSFIGPPSNLLANAEKPGTRSPEQKTKIPPWITIPSKPAYRYHEAAMLFSVPPHGVHEGYRLGTAMQNCSFLAIRTSTDFDPDWLGLVATLHQKQVLPVGFLSPSPPAHEPNGTAIWEEGEWLNTQEEGSTVYVAFGSELRLTQEQVTELALGLELSQLPFFWAYRGNSALLPAGFVDRTKGRGFVRSGWAPQSKFLAHPSVGVFLMHGGWGSAIEGLSFGKPLVMLPMLADQGPNSRVMEERKVGVEVWPRNERDGSFTRDAVVKALRFVAVEREGECVRANAREMQKIFGNKVRDDQHIDEFVRYLIEHRRDQV